MESGQNYNIEDEVIKIYLELYLNAIEFKKSKEYIDIIQNRMMFLVKRKEINSN